MKSIPVLIFAVSSFAQIVALEHQQGATQNALQEEYAPKYLYKIMSLDNWAESQCQTYLKLSPDDAQFIHFSREDQLSRICQKYWSHVPSYVVLKIETERLVGNLVFEENQPGGAKYYHIYNGAIPLRSVVECTTIQN